MLALFRKPLLPYLYIIRIRLLASLAYRFEVFTRLGVNAVLLFATVFIWQAAYRGVDSAAGVNERQMTTYAILAVLVQAVFSYNVQNTLRQRIRRGEIATDFLKPVHLLGFWLSEDLGTALSSLVMYLPPLLLVGAACFLLPLPASPAALILFLPSVLLSYAILWLMSALVGMISFWAAELGNMGVVKEAVVGALSGQLVPLWFFPDWMQQISRFLPFQYIYQVPLGIFIGRTGPEEAAAAMGVQAIWLAGFAALLALLWNRARRKLIVQGG